MADEKSYITPHGLVAFAADRAVIDRLLVALYEADKEILWDMYRSAAPMDAQVCNLIRGLLELLENNKELK